MNKNMQSRKWHITLNNLAKHGLTRDIILESLKLLSYDYMCMCDEVSDTGTPHTHMYVYSKSPIRFGRLKNVFPTAHIEKALGTHQENKDYITKSRKWANDKKADTNLSDTFLELGTMPPERIPAEDKKQKLLEMIKKGMTNDEIIEEDSDYIYRIKKMDEIRQMLIAKEFATKDRAVSVTFVTGETGLGKTRDIYAEHSGNMCRITDYRNDGRPYFDAYNGEDVLVFEEFTGQIPITEMLNYLDRYPIMLPARYQDKVACFTTVYITSNLSLYDLYPAEQITHPKTWNAFLRRISKVKEYYSDGTIKEYLLHSNDKEGAKDD